MTTRSLIQSAWQVRALLEGRRTQVRVPVRRIGPHGYIETDIEEIGDHWPLWEDEFGDWHRMDSPLGRPGDLLRVRETWYCDDIRVPERGPVPKMEPEGLDRRSLYYRASHLAPDGSTYTGFSGETMRHPWRPSTQMPAWASRLTLRVLDVRCHRVREISEADAKAEGCEPFGGRSSGPMDPDEFDGGTARDEFAGYWSDRYGAGSWERDWCFAASVEIVNREEAP